MKRAICRHDNCEKEAISFSDYCGEHSDAEAVAEAFNALESGLHERLYLDNIELQGLHLEGLEFEYFSIIDTDIDDSTIRNCDFYASTFINVYLGNCVLEGVTFEEAIEIQSSHFSDCTLRDTRFAVANINQTSFQEGTVLHNCRFEGGNLVGTLFSETEIRQTKVLNSHLNQSSVQDVFFEEVMFEDSDIYKTTFWDCSFNACSFKDITNDFEELDDSIELCLLRDTTFSNTYLPNDIRRWNGIDERPEVFYERVVQQVWKSVQTLKLESLDNLSALEVALKRLRALGDPPEAMRRQVTHIFTMLFNQAKATKDLSAFSKITAHISTIAQEWLVDVNQFLPNPAAQTQGSVLKLVFHTDDLSLDKGAKIFQGLRELEKIAYGDQKRAQIRDLQIGSITIEIGSDVQLIIMIVYALYQSANLFLDLRKKVLNNQKLKLEIDEKQKALATPAGEKEERTALEKEKLAEEINLLRLQQYTLLQKETGIDPEKILSPADQRRLSAAGKKLAEEVDGLDLHVRIAMEGVEQS